MDPDLFLTAVFVSWVMLIAFLGVAVMRYERRREALALRIDNLAQAPSRRGRLTAGQVRVGTPADRWAPGDTFSA